MKKEIKTSDRFEKKWVFKNSCYTEILISLYRSNFFFKEQHNSRLINSIYFDTNNFNCINDNLDGVNIRKKFRVRWYGHNSILKNPTLEIKCKKNFVSNKISIPLNKFNNFDIAKNYNIELLTKHINHNIFQNTNLKAMNLITYQRLYLISSNNLIRATLDYNIRSKKFINFQNDFFANYNDVILELKYDIDLDNYLRKNLKEMNTRYSKSSKYINYTLFSSNNYS